MTKQNVTRAITRAAALALVTLPLSVIGNTPPPLNSDKTFTTFGSCSSDSAPVLPEAWQASGLLTPFGGEGLSEFTSWVDTSADAMRVYVRHLSTGRVSDTLTYGNRSYKLLTNNQGEMSCAPMSTTEWSVPGVDIF